jgi:uncharacterized protein (TIGR00730 family)
MPKNICVFCASSSAVDSRYTRLAHDTGVEIARRGHTLVFGGTEVGLMAAVAAGVHQNGGKVIGVIPKSIEERGIAYATADELIVTGDMRERKSVMEQRSDGFLTLPGAFGTLEEFFEILVLRQLGYHEKPIVLLNESGFYDPLLEMFSNFYSKNFAKPVLADLYSVQAGLGPAFEYLENYRPGGTVSKWFEKL